MVVVRCKRCEKWKTSGLQDLLLDLPENMVLSAEGHDLRKQGNLRRHYFRSSGISSKLFNLIV